MKRKWVLEQYIPKVEKLKNAKSIHKKDEDGCMSTKNSFDKSIYTKNNGIKKVSKCRKIYIISIAELFHLKTDYKDRKPLYFTF